MMQSAQGSLARKFSRAHVFLKLRLRVHWHAEAFTSNHIAGTKREICEFGINGDRIGRRGRDCGVNLEKVIGDVAKVIGAFHVGLKRGRNFLAKKRVKIDALKLMVKNDGQNW